MWRQKSQQLLMRARFSRQLLPTCKATLPLAMACGNELMVRLVVVLSNFNDSMILIPLIPIGNTAINKEGSRTNYIAVYPSAKSYRPRGSWETSSIACSYEDVCYKKLKAVIFRAFKVTAAFCSIVVPGLRQ